MSDLNPKILSQLIGASAEPVILARIDLPDWPCILCNAAFEELAEVSGAGDRPFADVIEELAGRELALEVSESVRLHDDISIPIEISGKDYLLALKPLTENADDDAPRYCVAFVRSLVSSTGSSAGNEAQQALLRAKRRIRDLARDDAVTGLLNERAFREVLAHDWAVAAREKGRLGIVAFTLDDFDQYLAVFGRHAADSCLRRVAQAIRRCLRRASDVAGRVETNRGERLVVLAHAAEEEGVRQFAALIAETVRGLGLHHPRSRVDRFVTVSHHVIVAAPDHDGGDSTAFLAQATGD